jgi:hypothetical protein
MIKHTGNLVFNGTNFNVISDLNRVSYYFHLPSLIRLNLANTANNRRITFKVDEMGIAHSLEFNHEV